MTVTVKNKSPLVVPPAIRRRAGLKSGDRLEFKVSRGVITILPKLSPDELDDELDLRDPKMQRQIRQSNTDIRAGRKRPASELLAELQLASANPRKPQRQRG